MISTTTIEEKTKRYILGSGDNKMEFYVPLQCKAYEYLEIPFKLQGPTGTVLAVSANTFEKCMDKYYYDSYVPGGMKADLRYIGSTPVHNLGWNVDSVPTPVNQYPKGCRRHFVEVANTGDTIFKSQGLGLISAKMKIFDCNETLIDAGIENIQLMESDFYPGETRVLCFFQQALEENKHKLRFELNWHHDEVLNFFDPGESFSFIDVPVDITDMKNVNKEFNGDDCTQYQYHQKLRRFPKLLTDYNEYMMHTKVFEMDEGIKEGVLKVLVQPSKCLLTIKLVTGTDIFVSKIEISPSTNHITIDKSEFSDDWSVKVEGIEKPVMTTWYYPYRAVRFTNDPKGEIEKDLLKMKETGVNVVWLQLFPQMTFKGGMTPTYFTMQKARELGIKILPSIYFTNQYAYMEKEIGIAIDSAGDKLASAFMDPLDTRFGDALTAWFDKLYKEWGDVFYRTKSGKMPISLGEEVGLGYWELRVGGFKENSIAAFRNWLIEKYGSLEEINAVWGTGYKSLEYINPQLNSVSVKDYPMEWREGSEALKDLDTFRSLMIIKQNADASRKIREKYPQALMGIMIFPVYGFEGKEGNHYYSYDNYNWLAMRTSPFEEHVIDFALSDMEFITFLNVPGEIDWRYIAERTKEKGMIPVIYPEFNAIKLFKDKGMHSYWEKQGGYFSIQGVTGKDVRSLYPIFHAMKGIFEGGGIAGFYCWNDHPLYNRVTQVQIDELKFFSSLLA